MNPVCKIFIESNKLVGWNFRNYWETGWKIILGYRFTVIGRVALCALSIFYDSFDLSLIQTMVWCHPYIHVVPQWLHGSRLADRNVWKCSLKRKGWIFWIEICFDSVHKYFSEKRKHAMVLKSEGWTLKWESSKIYLLNGELSSLQ